MCILGTTLRCGRWNSWSGHVFPKLASTDSAPSCLKTFPNWGRRSGTRPWRSWGTSWRAYGNTQTRLERRPSNRYTNSSYLNSVGVKTSALNMLPFLFCIYIYLLCAQTAVCWVCVYTASKEACWHCRKCTWICINTLCFSIAIALKRSQTFFPPSIQRGNDFPDTSAR